jgi:hypothetical protein
MTRYEKIKSLSQKELNELKATGLMKTCTDFYIDVFDTFVIEFQKGIGAMQAYTNTGEIMCTSEKNVQKIIYNLSQQLTTE